MKHAEVDRSDRTNRTGQRFPEKKDFSCLQKYQSVEDEET
jgi:hypothetical protein